METLGGFLAIVALGMFVLSIIALIRPLPKLGLSSRKIAALSLLGSFVLMAIAGSMLPDSPPSPAAPGKSAAPPEQPAFTPLGKPVQIGDASVTIEKVETRRRVGIEYAYEKASEGGVLVVVHFAIKNTGAKPLAAYRIPEVKLIDTSGTEYDRDLAKTTSYAMERGDLNSKVWSDLNPGIKVRDAAVFEVSSEQYDPKKWLALIGNKEKVALQ